MDRRRISQPTDWSSGQEIKQLNENTKQPLEGKAKKLPAALPGDDPLEPPPKLSASQRDKKKLPGEKKKKLPAGGGHFNKTGDEWSNAEAAQLQKLVQSQGSGDWENKAKVLGRTAKAVERKWERAGDSPAGDPRTWSDAEFAQLQQLILKDGPGRWEIKAKLLGTGRTGTSLERKYARELSKGAVSMPTSKPNVRPSAENGGWTEDEDRCLAAVMAVAQSSTQKGNDMISWCEIAAAVNQAIGSVRSENSCRHRWSRIIGEHKPPTGQERRLAESWLGSNDGEAIAQKKGVKRKSEAPARGGKSRKEKTELTDEETTRVQPAAIESACKLCRRRAGFCRYRGEPGHLGKTAAAPKGARKLAVGAAGKQKKGVKRKSEPAARGGKSRKVKTELTDDEKTCEQPALEIECAVCKEMIVPEDLVTAPCEHSFCSGCLKRWLHKKEDESTQKTCPTCRSSLRALARRFPMEEPAGITGRI